MSPLTLRRWHSYLSLLAAPSVLFFTLTGALQLFGWQEEHDGYRPPAWLVVASTVHTDQVLEKHEDKLAEPEPAALPPPHQEPPPPPGRTIALKAYFFWIGVLLLVSTLFGAWMGVTQTPRKQLAWSLLVIGTVLPLGILLL